MGNHRQRDAKERHELFRLNEIDTAETLCEYNVLRV